MNMPRKRELVFLANVVVAALIVSGIHPYDRSTWWLEVLPVLIALPWLVARGLRGCVYTQVSDVETETNGLLTYDRQVLKPDAGLLRSLNAELYAAFDALGQDNHARR